jgi:hypothetical protein
MNTEIDGLKRSGNLFQWTSELGEVNVPAFFEAVGKMHSENDTISTLPLGPWTAGKAILAISQLTTAVGFLPILMRESAKLDIIVRSLHWETIRAYLTIYHWYDDGGPSLANFLFESHRIGGIKSLEATHPQFAGLVDHIVRYVQSAYQAKTQTGKAVSDLRDLPAGLYGLDLSMPAKVILKLPTMQPQSIHRKKTLQYATATKCFLDFISEHVIISGVKIMDKRLTESLKGKVHHTSESVKARLVICGGTIS